ncbi:hypothetical protein DFR52_101511 [Hoeflea marina]|uniref:Uncharacterized protein n=1 Tax=Hoeflea marina TaxID=274592 RepID=A0A317PQS5_9HYPH|nr:hypothetical protein [Hoeflea marina]PWW03823.1 hypothetical protein DFR52_101511 [Hoeflea marina]
MKVYWGMLAPENVKPSRRRLTLGLGRAVMLYNEAAVPGLGGLWFIRQAALALIGIQVAEEFPSAGSKIEVANAIEALACWVGYQERDWSRGDWRLRGPLKLKSLDDRKLERTFRRLKSPSSYVTQPMRMGCVEALPGMGFVDANGSRFNSFSVNARGHELIEAVFGEKGQGRRYVPAYLRDWVRGEPDNFTTSLRQKLNPTSDAGQNARKVMREALAFPGPDAERRRNALAWVERIDAGGKFGVNPHTHWTNRPEEIDDHHWKDMRAGAVLVQTRSAAIGVLAHIEQEIVVHSRLNLTRPLPEGVSASLRLWRKEAQGFLALDGHGPSEAAAAAREFCNESLQSDVQAITKLVNRENHTLRVTGNAVVPTAAWRTDAVLTVDDGEGNASGIDTAAEGAEDGALVPAERDVLPLAISPRLVYLRRLALDLNGQLGMFIEAQGRN